MDLLVEGVGELCEDSLKEILEAGTGGEAGLEGYYDMRGLGALLVVGLGWGLKCFSLWQEWRILTFHRSPHSCVM